VCKELDWIQKQLIKTVNKLIENVVLTLTLRGVYIDGVVESQRALGALANYNPLKSLKPMACGD
jgi:hypothetical protein